MLWFSRLLYIILFDFFGRYTLSPMRVPVLCRVAFGGSCVFCSPLELPTGLILAMLIPAVKFEAVGWVGVSEVDYFMPSSLLEFKFEFGSHNRLGFIFNWSRVKLFLLHSSYWPPRLSRSPRFLVKILSFCVFLYVPIFYFNLDFKLFFLHPTTSFRLSTMPPVY